MTANVHAFVLLGTSSIRHPRQRLPNVVTKDKILFYCSIVNIKLGQKLSSEQNDETRYSSAPNCTNAMLAAVASYFSLMYLDIMFVPNSFVTKEVLVSSIISNRNCAVSYFVVSSIFFSFI
jgi:hypothetical protein